MYSAATTPNAYDLGVRLIVEKNALPDGRKQADIPRMILCGSGTCSSISMQVTMSKLCEWVVAKASIVVSR